MNSFLKKNKISLLFFIFLFILSFNFDVKAQNLIACLDSNGNIVSTIYEGEICPAGSSYGSAFFISNNQNTNTNNINNSITNTQQTNNANINNSSSQYVVCPNGIVVVAASYCATLGNNISNINNNTVNSTNPINSNSTPIYTNQNQYQETLINVDPSLEYGLFLNIDPTEYKYCVLITRDLAFGSRDASTGNEVSALQSYLSDRGFLEYNATGYYGRATELAIKKFQYRNQIAVLGYVNNETRDIIKELTCAKQVSYIDKPISPSKSTKTYTNTKTNTSSTIIPATKYTNTNSVNNSNSSSYTSVSPSSNTSIKGPTLNNNKLSSTYGNISLSKGNNLYFTFSSNSSSATICLSMNGNCSQISNNVTITEGIKGNLYESLKLGDKWSFTLYGSSGWGKAGDKVYIYLRDNASSDVISVYTVNIIN